MFDWLTDGIVSYIIDVFTSLVANIESLSILAQKTPSQFNPEIWQTITTFNKTAVLPVAYLIFGCFIMADFVKVFS